MSRFRFDPNRTKPRTATEKRHRKLLGYQLKRLRKEINAEKKARKS